MAPLYDIVLNSRDRIAGTIDNAVFNVQLPHTLQGPVRVTLRDFVVSRSNSVATSVPLHVSLPQALNTTCFDTTTGGPTGHLATIAAPMGRLREYPPAAMTGGTTNLLGQSYGNGTYTVSGGGGWFDANWRVMDKVETTSTTNRNYVVNTGLPQGVAAVVTTATNGMSYTGAWINVAMPQAIFVASYSVTPAGDNAKGVSQWTLLGSADGGATWDHLDSRPYADMTAGQAMVRPVTTSRAYSLYRLVCQRAGNTNFSNFRDYCSMSSGRPIQGSGSCNQERTDYKDV
jgi:hypothetical protein